MIQLTVKDIKDYQTCALLYAYRNVNPIYEYIPNHMLMDGRFESALKNVLTFYFHKKQSGSQPTFDYLVKKWEKLWFPKDTLVADIMLGKHNSTNYSLAKASNIAVQGLQGMYETFSQDYSIPLLIDEPFSVALGKTSTLNGVFDLVMRSKEGKFTVYKWGANIKKAKLSALQMDFAALKYSFDYRNSDREIGDVDYVFFDLSLPSPKPVKMEPNSEDVDSLKFWAKSILTDETYAPRRGLTTYCKECPFDSPCSKFSGWGTNAKS